MESKKINQLATELAPDLSDLTIIGDPTTGISKKITLSQMASLFTGTVEEYATLAAFPLVGVADTIYVALDTNIIYRYDTSLSAYVILSPNIINSLVFSDANGFDGTITLVGSVATLSITTALTLGSVPFIGASGSLSQDNANLFFDDTNNRLGIATALPTTPLDVFGSGIIGRLNATSTNNAFLGFASNGTNKWSAGNVQSDHRFRIFSEANSAELITILQTGEFGIGIANPTTKFHIDGAASALIANLDANVSIAKSVSYRSDNSARINLEVSGTESGSNAGADFFLRTFTDAGSLLETPFTIVRSTGVTTIKSLTLTNVLSVANGGTGSATQNFVDLTSIQTAAGAKTFSAITTISNATASTSTTTGGLVVTGGVGIGGALFGTSASFSSTATATAFIPSGATIPTNGMYLSAANTLDFATNTTNRLTITSAGNVGIGTSSPVTTNLVGSMTIVKSYNSDTPVSTTAQTYYTNQSNLYLFGRNAGLSIITNSTNEEGTIFFGNASTVAYASINTGSGTTSVGGDMNFKVGSNTERMRITSAGNVGIGTSGPDSKLQVAGTCKIDSALTCVSEIIVGGSGSYPTGGVGFRNDGTNFNIYYGANNCIFKDVSNVERMRITSGGLVGIGRTPTTNILEINGDASKTSAGSWLANSDINIKTDINTIQGALERINKVRLVSFKYKDEYKEVYTSIKDKYYQNVIAQEYQEIYPDYVYDSGEIFEEHNILQVDTNPMFVDSVSAIQELSKIVQEQQAQIEELKALIAAK